MNFFQKIGNSLARFMYGRNGVDQLGFVTLWAAIILDVVNLFVRNQVAYSILSAVAMVLTIWMVFRMFSKNLSKRRAENAAYMNKVVYPLRQALSRSRDKEHKYFTCPNCRTVCRVPRGKGRIVITCPKCGAALIKRKTKRGKVFYGCEKYPECSFVSWDKPVKEKCPKCGGMMVHKMGHGGGFDACIAEGCGYTTKQNKQDKKGSEE